MTFGREIDQAASFAMMDHARARGITIFDTAAVYAGGASERVVGAWLASRRPDPGALMVATKLLPRQAPGGRAAGLPFRSAARASENLFSRGGLSPAGATRSRRRPRRPASD
ncbi:MAG: aldo/keto reductase [Verrucomicrobia bacterium]|nr:aldo/keto reductase [Verrucomicrobiota bacterium]